MFAALNSMSGSAPEFQTKKALVIINCQNDAFYEQGDFSITKNPEFVEPLRELIPYFRRAGDVIWVRTEMGVLPSTPSPDAEKIEKDSVKTGEENKITQNTKEANILDDTRTKTTGRAAPNRTNPSSKEPKLMQTYDPSSRLKRLITNSSADAMAEKRSFNLQVLDGDEGDSLEERLVKPRKGQQSKFFVSGTEGAEISDRLKDLMEPDDMVVTKHFYSAFDQTSLLTSLRMQLITEVYLCGGLTNASIYSTAADAVQHGLEVSVVEDCIGYRSAEKHDEALHQMSEIMGVIQISSGEIIEESGGRVIPDSDTPGITLTELSIGAEAKEAQAALLANKSGSTRKDASRTALQDADIPIPSVEATDGSYPGTPASSKAGTQPRTMNRVLARTRQRTLGPDDTIASGDSKIIYDWLDDGKADNTFNWLKKEVDWQTMDHRGGQVPRLVAVQGEIGKDGEVPLYRHPADESPPLLSFSPTVLKIRKQLESLLDQPFNHVLMQFYRTGEDNISEHADKTLDIVRDSSIVNISLGAQRVMTLRTKKSGASTTPDSAGTRSVQRVDMPHNSVFVLGPQSNREWLHGVRADKRPSVEKTDQEKSFNGERISLTFRHIGTYMHERQQLIWGTGATQKSKSRASRISTSDSTAMENMIIAFGKENHNADFDWDANYGSGFDVVNLRTIASPAKLALSSDPIANLRVQLCLEESNIPYTIVDRSALRHYAASSPLNEKPWIHGLANVETPILSFLGPTGTAGIEGDLAILIVLERRNRNEAHTYTTAQLYSCIAQSNELLYLWYELQHCLLTTASNTMTSSPSPSDSKIPTPRSTAASPTHRFQIENKNRRLTPEMVLHAELESMLQGWEEWFATENKEYPFIAGDFWSVIDCAFWPVFRALVEEGGGENTVGTALKGAVGVDMGKYPWLGAYHKRASKRESVRRLFRK